MKGISVVMPAFQAEATISGAVSSVINQHYKHWELIIVADDEIDYESVLGRVGLLQSNIKFLSTEGSGSGSPIPRNMGLDAAQFEYSAILDADDLMHPQKFELSIAQLPYYPVISCALQLLTEDHLPLRTVGAGVDSVLTCRNYKFTNFSSDSMLIYDRQVADPRFDSTLSCVTDVDFLLKLFSKTEHCFHFGKTLHFYVKRPISVTNGPGASQKIADTKRLMLKRLTSGHYSFADSHSIPDVERFFTLSLMAEAVYGDALLSQPEALFEDYIEQVIRSKATDLCEHKQSGYFTDDSP
jgi:glycosyltransferase involved in cell wall biosynthesis